MLLIAGLEYSYAEKCLILREQIQLRKKLDGIAKIGTTKLHNYTGLPPTPALLVAPTTPLTKQKQECPWLYILCNTHHHMCTYLLGLKYPEPLPALWNLFCMMCDREKAHGIPPPIGHNYK